MKRRKFVQSTLAGASAAALLPTFSIGRSGGSANSRLNVAFIGIGNVGKMAFEGIPDENWVALCDVDQSYIDEAKANWPQAKQARTFKDFRRMFDEMGDEIDAVCVSTPDHTHFVATMWAIENGSHVCTQKPLTRTVWEARALRKAANEKGVITNMANQGHTYDGIRQCKEWLEYGAIGKVTAVHSWEGGPEWGNGWFELPETFPPPTHSVPKSLDWDLWLGPLEMREFSDFYHPKKWRGFWDLGTGMLGDWFCHTCDGPVWALDLYDPAYVELITRSRANPNGIIPNQSVVKWHFPARHNKPACDLFWHDGGLRPEAPENWDFGSIPKRGSFFYGTDNALFLNERSNYPRIVNRKDMRDFQKSGLPRESFPRLPKDLQQPFAEWIAAIKGKLDYQPGSNFNYGARLSEVALLGVLAQRFGGRIDWDAKNGLITNRPELNVFLKEPTRQGWEIGQHYSIVNFS